MTATARGFWLVMGLLVLAGSSAGRLAVNVTEDLEFDLQDDRFQTGGRLLSTWSSLTGNNFTINEIDPSTGARGRQLLVSQNYIQLFAITPAIDVAGKRIFLPVVTQEQALLVGFKILGSVATQVTSVEIPLSYVLAVQYDQVTDRVFIVLQAEDTPAPAITVGYIDLKSNTFTNFTTLNPGIIPAEESIGGGSSVLLAEKRLLVLSTRARGTSGSGNGYLTLVSLNTGKVTDVPLADNKNVAVAMALNTKTNQIASLVMPVNSSSLSLTFGFLELNGQVTPLHKWTNLAFMFVVGSLATIDSDDGIMYTVMGNGEGPPVALVSIDITTGQRTNAANFMRQQPQSIFYLPN